MIWTWWEDRLGEGTLEIRPSPSRAKAAAIRRNPRLTRDVDSRQTRRLCALRLLAVLQRLRSRAPPEDYVERAQPHYKIQDTSSLNLLREEASV